MQDEKCTFLILGLTIYLTDQIYEKREETLSLKTSFFWFRAMSLTNYHFALLA